MRLFLACFYSFKTIRPHDFWHRPWDILDDIGTGYYRLIDWESDANLNYMRFTFSREIYKDVTITLEENYKKPTFSDILRRIWEWI